MIQFYIPWEGEGEGGYDENLKLKHRTGFLVKKRIPTFFSLVLKEKNPNFLFISISKEKNPNFFFISISKEKNPNLFRITFLLKKKESRTLCPGFFFLVS